MTAQSWAVVLVVGASAYYLWQRARRRTRPKKKMANDKRPDVPLSRLKKHSLERFRARPTARTYTGWQ
ncbi:MAG: hypothetical protein R3A47_02425 [Polyangiales bacterium]